MSIITTREIPAVKFDDLDPSDEQPRVLFITDLSVIWGGDQPHWHEEGILEAMAWSDVSNATSRWNRAVVVCPEVSMTDIVVGDFWSAWTRWARHMSWDLETNLKLRFWHPGGRPDHAAFGEPDASRQLEITFYTGEFFDSFESPADAWEHILIVSLKQPGTFPHLRSWLHPEAQHKSLGEHFARGDFVVYTTAEMGDVPTTQVVVLGRNGARAFTMPIRDLDRSVD